MLDKHLIHNGNLSDFCMQIKRNMCFQIVNYTWDSIDSHSIWYALPTSVYRCFAKIFRDSIKYSHSFFGCSSVYPVSCPEACPWPLELDTKPRDTFTTRLLRVWKFLITNIRGPLRLRATDHNHSVCPRDTFQWVREMRNCGGEKSVQEESES